MSSHRIPNIIANRYPVTCSFLGPEALNCLLENKHLEEKPGEFVRILSEFPAKEGMPPFLPDLARLEEAYNSALNAHLSAGANLDTLELNPTLQLVPVSWSDLPQLFSAEKRKSPPSSPQQADEMIMVWRMPAARAIGIQTASSEDLLALKILAEGLSPENAARQGGAAVGAIDRVLRNAIEKGIVLSPSSKIRRSYLQMREGKEVVHQDHTSVFTIQWHITQACDLHCKHCYDRTGRGSMSLKEGSTVLRRFRAFCKKRFVQGHITFSGGNPFLNEHFTALYRAASDMGFSLAVLGNPVSREQLEKVVSIQEPTHFQVSLEGLQQHNDFIRGKGNFESVINFLEILRDLNIYSMVMLTLTKDNMDQVLPLAEILRDKADLFTFNRLSLVGEGAHLTPPDKVDYERFLDAYLAAAESNPVLGFKDNLLNISLQRKELELFEGCTGYGCGAAFNFVAVCADGEVHACRKFPSLVGNILTQGLEEIYDSEAARRYRSRPESCLACPLCSRCGGCLAVTSSHGLDISKDRDPYCFM